MYDYLGGSLGTLTRAKHGRSRAINAENPTGERERAVWRQAIWSIQKRQPVSAPYRQRGDGHTG